MNHIVAAIDFSDVSEAVLNQAKAQARAFGAKLHLVHVWDPDTSADTAYGAEPALAINVSDERMQSLKDRIEAEAETVANEGIDCSGTLLVGRPQRSLARYGRETHADLVVIGSHGHSALGSLLMGSCASALVRKACFPLLVIPVLEADEERE